MRMYYEASPSFQRELKSKDIDFQLAPPGMHRRNTAEHLIRTFKDHFIRGIFSSDPDFSMQNWDRLLEHAGITLNLLRHSILNPKLLAYSQLNGNLDYKRNPIPSPGTITLVNDKLHKSGAPGHHTSKKGIMHVQIGYIIDVLQSTYPRQHRNKSPT